MTSERWTESRVFEALKKRFPSPAFVLLPQVRSATGSSSKVRTADAVAVSTWPSRGLYITGIEIKVSLADWRRELADPTKAESIQQYCRYWYIAAPKGVVPGGEVPDNWGLLECNARSTTETKRPERLDEAPPDILFTAAVLRRASEVMRTQADVEQAIQAYRTQAEESGMKCQEATLVSDELEDLKSAVQQFEAASGVSLAKYRGGDIGRAVKLVREAGVAQCVRRATSLRDDARQIAERLDKSLAAMTADDPEATP